MMKTHLFSAILLLPLATSNAFAQPVAQTVEAVLEANQKAMGDVPAEGTLRVQYAAEVNGLQGTATYTTDLATGMFIEELDAYPVSGTGGFDGKTPWMRDISGMSVTQEGGDRVPVAVNEAYRNANLWWRADRGGAAGQLCRARAGRRQRARSSRGDAAARLEFRRVVRRRLAPAGAHSRAADVLQDATDLRRLSSLRHVMLAGTRAVDFGTGPTNIQKMKVKQRDARACARTERLRAADQSRARR